MNPKSTLTLKIESLSYSGGRGVGRFEGLVVFVPGTAPGDLVRVRITEQKPRFAEAEVVEMLEPSPARRTPPCVVAGRCGGCPWQHVDYPVQIAQKEKILRDSLRKISGFVWRPFLAAADEFHYRNRIQLHVRDGQVGFFAKGTRDLVAVEFCWISDAKINTRLQQLTHEERRASRIELALRPDGDVAVMLEKRDAEEALFSQVNTAQNRRLIASMLEVIEGTPEWIFDLYAGAGNLTQPLAERFPGVLLHAVELSRASVARAPKLARVQFHTGDVAKVLSRLAPQEGHGLAVLDPPRAGADKTVIFELLRHRPRQLIYISCNPATFARDAERLTHDGSYRLHSVQGLDMFPQTEHVELVAMFARRDATVS